MDSLLRRVGSPQGVRCPWLAVVVATTVLAGSTGALAQTTTPAPAPADDNDAVQTMALPDALSYARAHQPSVIVAQARIAAARAAAEVPRAQWLPSLGVAAQGFLGTANNTTAMYLSSPEVALPRVGGSRANAELDWTPYASALVAAGASQEVFDFGRIAAQTAAADAAVEVERHRADEDWLRVDLAVREAYYAVLAARAVVRASEDAFQRASTHRDMAAAWVNQGLRPRIELERAEADLARFDVARIRARGGLQAAQNVFAAAVGVTSALLDAAGDAGVTDTLPSIVQALGAAAERDPRIQQTLARIRQQEARTRAIDAETRPNLALTAAVSVRAGTAPPSSMASGNYPGFAPNYDVGVVLNWPLFDAVINARREASRQQEGVLRAELESERELQAAAVRQAYLAVQIAQGSLPALERALAAAQANYAQAEARFRAGLGTSVELADAEALRTEAEIQLAIGRFQISRAFARLATAMAEGL